MPRKVAPEHLDEGIRASVQMLCKAGFKTFTSCEGGHGHPFRHPTIGLTLVGEYFTFRDRLAAFLKTQGCRSFEISLMTCYHPTYRKPKDLVYVEGLDLLSPEKRRRVHASIRRRELRLARILQSLTTIRR